MSFSTRERRAVRIDFSDDPGLTEQHHQDSCDIHNILKKSERTGILEHVNATMGQYGTMPDSVSYQEHMNAIIAAQHLFESVPAKIRQRFGNDPAQYIDFMQRDENYEEIQNMGFDVSHLKKPEKVEEPPK